VVAETVIDGGGGGEVVVFSRPFRDSSGGIAGVTITGGGVGIDCEAAHPVIDRCILTGCDEGAIRCSRSSPTITRCILSGNQASSGAGLYVTDGSLPTIRNCRIVDNSASSYGGGAYCRGGASLVLENCIVVGNTARYGGGVDYNEGAPVLSNCTIAHNSADHGGGLYVYSASPIMNNCIVWNNEPDQIDVHSGVMDAAHSDIQGGWPGEGNIDQDPEFASFRGHDYLLRPASPCIDAGDPMIEDGLHDSHPSWPDWYPNAARSDMGAYGGPENGAWLGALD